VRVLERLCCMFEGVSEEGVTFADEDATKAGKLASHLLQHLLQQVLLLALLHVLLAATHRNNG